MDIWLPLLIIILGSFAVYAIIDSLPETESENPSSSDYTDLWCLRAISEKNWKELGYLKGDILDELDCRDVLRDKIDEKVLTTDPKKARQALIDLGLIKN